MSEQEDMISLFMKAVYNTANADQLIRLAKTLEELKRVAECEAITSYALSKYPFDLSLRIFRAEFSMRRSAWLEAIQRWESIMADFDKYPTGVFVRMATCLIQTLDFKNALAAIDRCLAIDPCYEKAVETKDLIESKSTTRYSINFNRLTDTGKAAIDTAAQNLRPQEVKNFSLRGWIGVRPDQDSSVVIERYDSASAQLEMSEIRWDVINHLKTKDSNSYNPLCGYRTTIDMTQVKRIGLCTGGTISWVYSITISEAMQVLKGQDGWLFLDNDSNRSVDIHQGKVLLGESEIEDWSRYFDNLQTLQKIVPTYFVIVPSKESVHPELYPYSRAAITITEQVKELSPSGSAADFFPVDALKNTPKSYFKTDTHWSDAGAHVIYTQIVEKFGIPPLSDILFEERETPGDLGSKLPLRETDVGMMLSPETAPSATTSFTNHVINSGRIEAWQNIDAPVQKTIMIFGDSFSENLALFFRRQFRRTVRVYSPASPIKALFDLEQPDYLLLQTNERFLKSPPKIFPEQGNTTIEIKIGTLTPSDKENLKSAIQQHSTTDPLQDFYLNLLNR